MERILKNKIKNNQTLKKYTILPFAGYIGSFDASILSHILFVRRDEIFTSKWNLFIGH